MRRRLLVALALVTTSGVWVVADASPADAAGLPICNGVTWIYQGTPTGLMAETLIPSYGNWNFQCNLERGAGQGLPWSHGTRTAIRQLQLSINRCYPGAPYTPLTQDGLYGSRTTAAVEYVQRREGVRVDGEAGPMTRRAMDWRWYENYFDESYCDIVWQQG